MNSQLRTLFINSSNQQGHSEWSRLLVSVAFGGTHHQGVVVLDRLSKPQSQITDCLGTALDSNLFIIGEIVHLTSHSSMIHHCPRIGRQSRHGTSDMRVDFHDFLDRRGFDKWGWDSFLDSKDSSFGGSDAHCCGSELRLVEDVGVGLTLMASIAYSTTC